MTQANPNPPMVSSWQVAGIFSALLFSACIGLGVFVKHEHRQVVQRKAAAAATMADLALQISAEAAKSASLDAAVTQARKNAADEAKPAQEKLKREHAAAVEKQEQETAAAIAAMEQEKAKLTEEKKALEASRKSAEEDNNTLTKQLAAKEQELQKLQTTEK